MRPFKNRLATERSREMSTPEYQKEAEFGQALLLWLAALVFMVVGFANGLGKLVQQRNHAQGLCMNEKVGFLSYKVWPMIFTKHLGTCEIGAKANTFRGLTVIFVILLALALIYATHYIYEYGAYGAGEIGEGIATGIVFLVVAAAVLAVLLVYAFVIAAMFMIGILVLAAADS